MTAPLAAESEFTTHSHNGECYLISKSSLFPFASGAAFGRYDKVGQMCADVGAEVLDVAVEGEMQVLADFAGKKIMKRLDSRKFEEERKFVKNSLFRGIRERS